MTPFSKFGLERGWDTIMLAICIVLTMVICTIYLDRTVTENTASTHQALILATDQIQQEISLRDQNQKLISDHLDIINQRDQLILDRLAFQHLLLDQIRKRRQ